MSLQNNVSPTNFVSSLISTKSLDAFKYFPVYWIVVSQLLTCLNTFLVRFIIFRTESIPLMIFLEIIRP